MVVHPRSPFFPQLFFVRKNSLVCRDRVDPFDLIQHSQLVLTAGQSVHQIRLQATYDEDFDGACHLIHEVQPIGDPRELCETTVGLVAIPCPHDPTDHVLYGPFKDRDVASTWIASEFPRSRSVARIFYPVPSAFGFAVGVWRAEMDSLLAAREVEYAPRFGGPKQARQRPTHRALESLRRPVEPPFRALAAERKYGAPLNIRSEGDQARVVDELLRLVSPADRAIANELVRTLLRGFVRQT